MARYVDEYMGIVGHDIPPRGMDPNYRGGYWGMRMEPGHAQADYGRYRMRHAEDYGGAGGFRGTAGPAGPPFRAPMPMKVPVHSGGGGVRDARYDRDLWRDFNANSPALSRERGRYDDEQRRRLPRGVSPWYRPERPDYANRGISDAGYSEGWAWGPMRGSR